MLTLERAVTSDDEKGRPLRDGQGHGAGRGAGRLWPLGERPGEIQRSEISSITSSHGRRYSVQGISPLSSDSGVINGMPCFS